MGYDYAKDNAAYLDHWIKAMKEEPGILFKSAS